MPDPFSRPFTVGWEHLDANGHMRNTAYLDLAVDLRMMFFKDSGFELQEFERQRIGPLVRRDEVEYFRLTAPPPALLQAFTTLARTEDFVTLKSSLTQTPP